MDILSFIARIFVWLHFFFCKIKHTDDKLFQHILKEKDLTLCMFSRAARETVDCNMLHQIHL